MAHWFLIFASSFGFLLQSALALQCRYENLFGESEHLSCPGRLDDPDEVHCCGSEHVKFCCSAVLLLGDRGKGGEGRGKGGEGRPHPEENWVHENFGLFIAIVVGASALSVFLCCRYCPFCPLRKRRSGQVLRQGQENQLTATHQQQTPASPAGYNAGSHPPVTVHPQQNFQLSPSGAVQPSGYPSAEAFGYPPLPAQQLGYHSAEPQMYPPAEPQGYSPAQQPGYPPAELPTSPPAEPPAYQPPSYQSAVQTEDCHKQQPYNPNM